MAPKKTSHGNALRAIAIAILMAAGSGCSVFEALGGMPRVSDEMALKTTDNKQIFSCLEKTILELNESRRVWITKVTKDDEMSGTFETGNFSDPNVVGFRLRATRIKEKNLLKLELKGAGPYYSDLGVSQGMQSLKYKLRECLEADLPSPSR